VYNNIPHWRGRVGLRFGMYTVCWKCVKISLGEEAESALKEGLIKRANDAVNKMQKFTNYARV
jgi:hypothetical protein